MPKSGAGKPFEISITDFSGGLNTLDNPRELDENESQILHNFDIVGKGSIQKRYGYDLVSSGGTDATGVSGLLAYRKTGGTSDKFLLIFNQQNVYSITDTNTAWVDQGATTFTIGERAAGVVFNDLAIFNAIDGNSSILKFDGTTLSQLGGGAPPNAGVLATNDRVVFGSRVASTPSLLYWSELDDPDNWVSGIAGNQNIAVNDGTRVSAIVVHNENMTVFKDEDKHALFPVLDGTNDSPIGYVTKATSDRSDGTSSPRSVANAYTGVYFLGSPEKGFQRYGIQGTFPDRRNPENLSFVISPTVAQITRSALAKATAIYFDNIYYCAAPVGSTINNTTFKYFDIFGAWSTSSIPASCFEKFENEKGEREVYFGLETDNKLCKFNKRFYDLFDDETATGFPITAIWRSKIHRIGTRNRFKTVIVRGAITDSDSTDIKFRIRVRVQGAEEQNGVLTQIGRTKVREFSITKADILLDDEDSSNSLSNVGNFNVGNQFVGLSGEEQQLKEFYKIIQIPDIINEGEEISFELESGNEGEGIRLDLITCLGNRLPDPDIIF